MIAKIINLKIAKAVLVIITLRAPLSGLAPDGIGMTIIIVDLINTPVKKTNVFVPMVLQCLMPSAW
jgi:hypothetical protein